MVARAPISGQELVVKRVGRVFADGSFDVVGDNSVVSTDSRHFGSLAPASYEGRVLGVYAPRIRRLR